MPVKEAEFKILSDNRQAGHNYFLMDRFEAGLVLTGTEVKSAKSGKIQLRESYATIDKNEAWLVNAHISEYSHGNRENHSPVRSRKLLLHRREITQLIGRAETKGLTLVPLKLYLKGGHAKIELGLCRGKKLYDKRDAIAERDVKREIERVIRTR